MNVDFEIKEIEITQASKFSDYINDRFFDSKEDDQDLMRLIDSIKNQGLINPIVLAYDNEDNTMFEIISGRRRLKAIKEICKETGSFKALCRILPKNTDRETRNIIAFHDNENRKDLDESVKFMPIYLLVANAFYKIDQISKNSLLEVRDNKLREFLRKVSKGDKVDDSNTLAVIRKLADQVKINEKIFVKKLYEIAQIDSNFFKIKARFEIETKELLKYKNSNNEEVKELLDEVFFVMNCINSFKKNMPDDEVQKLLSEINQKIKARFDMEVSFDEWQNASQRKEAITNIISKYIKAIKEILANLKKNEAKTPSGEKVIKAFLKTATESEMEQILALIEKMRKEKEQ